ncbi:phosphoribosyltransferase family protein [Pseudofrankia sp. DC12]|uniref:phosphoribosyltransferase family protein n=1 Tax=Pseudofrankia sp. DC12 TaxID=683315 RepID=UPI000A75A015|nr:phosphoribosyltransferase family protein [Pseudofrankia sp. DC12]
MADLLLHSAAAVVTMDDDPAATGQGPIAGGWVAVRDGRIAAVGGPGDPRPDADEAVDLTGHVVLPGLVSAHQHSMDYLLRACTTQPADFPGWLAAPGQPRLGGTDDSGEGAAEMADERATYRATVGSQEIDLPLTPISDDLTVALLMTIDVGLTFIRQAGADLAALLAPSRPEVVVSAATLGIPVAIEVSRALGLDDYVILQKTPKAHLADALTEPLQSITTGVPQRLLLDRARVPAVAGRRVALVDDVIATGGSIAASLRLLRAVGADVVTIGALLVEGSGWGPALGDDAALVTALGRIPVFRPTSGGALAEHWD